MSFDKFEEVLFQLDSLVDFLNNGYYDPPLSERDYQLSKLIDQLVSHAQENLKDVK